MAASAARIAPSSARAPRGAIAGGTNSAIRTAPATMGYAVRR
jgi:hypothetical protein